MIEVAAVLIVEPDEQRVRPSATTHDRVDDGGREALADLNVLRVLLRAEVEVGIDDAHCRQGSICCISEEAVDAPQVACGLKHAQRVQVAGALDLAADGPNHAGNQMAGQETKPAIQVQ